MKRAFGYQDVQEKTLGKKKAIQEKKALLQLKLNFCRLNQSWLIVL